MDETRLLRELFHNWWWFIYNAVLITIILFVFGHQEIFLEFGILVNRMKVGGIRLVDSVKK